jgi:hypothetical protein
MNMGLWAVVSRCSMRKKSSGLISWIVALLICLLLPATGICEEYQVKLKSGRIIKTKGCYEKDGTVFVYRYRNYIGIDKSEIEEIIQTQDSAATEDSYSPKQASSGKGASSAQKAKSAKMKNSQTSPRRMKNR